MVRVYGTTKGSPARAIGGKNRPFVFLLLNVGTRFAR